MRNPGLLISCLALALPITAFAEPSSPASRVALHASEVVDATGADAAQIHALVAAEIARRGASLAGSDEVSAFLSRRPDRSCAALNDAERTRCLADLARGLNADRSVLVTVAPYAGERIILTAVVVSSKGTVLQEVPPSPYPRGAKRVLRESIGTALRDFVSSLKILEPAPDEHVAPLTTVNPHSASPSTSTASPASTSAASPATTTTAPPPPTAAVTKPAPPVPERAPPTTRGARRTTGFVVAAAGLILATGGGFFMSDATAKANEFNQAYRVGRPGADLEEHLASLRADANRSQAIGLSGIGLGAAAVIGGALLISTSDDSKAAVSNVHWLVGPGSLAVRLQLP
jgi:cell division septation protein DedD